MKDLAWLRCRLIGAVRPQDPAYPGYAYADQAFSESAAQGAPTRPLIVAINGILYGLRGDLRGGVWASKRLPIGISVNRGEVRVVLDAILRNSAFGLVVWLILVMAPTLLSGTLIVSLVAGGGAVTTAPPPTSKEVAS